MRNWSLTNKHLQSDLEENIVKKENDRTEKSPGITRRSFIRQVGMGTAVFATAGIGPWFIKNARSTSGELKLFTWPDYSKPEVINAFEKETGIKVKVTNYSSNQECMNKLRAARATGFDIAQPSLTEYELHMEYDLYQEIDEKKSQIWITWNRFFMKSQKHWAA